MAVFTPQGRAHVHVCVCVCVCACALTCARAPSICHISRTQHLQRRRGGRAARSGSARIRLNRPAVHHLESTQRRRTLRPK